MKLFLLLPFLFCFFDLNAQTDNTVEPEKVQFDSIREFLKNDRLEGVLNDKLKNEKESQLKNKAIERSRFNLPNENDFWSFFSEYWLVKEAQVLKWDFQKPDYGLQEAMTLMMQTLGFYEKKFKILLINTPIVTHFALPANPGEYIFLLSVPFIRTLDLSKLEIALLLIEDYLRVEAGFMKDFLRNPELVKTFGENYYDKKFNFETFDKLAQSYSNFVYQKGFNFQQQFEVTNQMSNLLKSDLKLWSTYNQMIKKIDDMIKNNILYKDYTKIYPSPELQLQWMNPSKDKK